MRVGDRVKVEAFAFLPPGVVLEDDVFVGPHACFTNDRRPRARGEWERVDTVVRRGASIGTGAVVLPGVEIGAGAMLHSPMCQYLEASQQGGLEASNFSEVR